MNAMCKIGAFALLSSAISIAAARPAARDLTNQAKISEGQARTWALEKVPGGTVMRQELEEGSGRLLWSFDIAQSGSAGVTEVQVDAKTGQIVSVTKQTSAREAGEAGEQRGPAYQSGRE